MGSGSFKSQPGAHAHTVPLVMSSFFFIGFLKDVQHSTEKKRWKKENSSNAGALMTTNLNDVQTFF